MISATQSIADQTDIEPLVEAFMQDVVARSPGETEFHQAVHEVARSVMPVIQANPVYRDAKILERLNHSFLL